MLIQVLGLSYGQGVLKRKNYQPEVSVNKLSFAVVVVALLFYVHGKHLRSCRDGQFTKLHISWAGLDLLSG